MDRGQGGGILQGRGRTDHWLENMFLIKTNVGNSAGGKGRWIELKDSFKVQRFNLECSIQKVPVKNEKIIIFYQMKNQPYKCNIEHAMLRHLLLGFPL